MRATRRAPGESERGFALPLTLFVLAVLALLAAALAGVTAAEIQTGRLVDWDRKALYLAEAGLEHQIFEWKRDQNSPAVGVVSLGGSPLEMRYAVAVQDAGTGRCGGTPDPNWRWWRVTSRGELVQAGSPVHSRTVEALAEIEYQGGSPRSVVLCRWSSR